MVLDSGADEVFVWVGKGATSEEKVYSHQMADVCQLLLGFLTLSR